MSLSSRGSKAWVEKIIKTYKDKGTVVIISTNTEIGTRRGEDVKFVKDFMHEVFLYEKGIQVNKGDMISIKSFFLRNCRGKAIFMHPSITITEWEIVLRNKFDAHYYKQKEEQEVKEIKKKQRQKLEAEYAEDELYQEQELDDYIENIDEDNPF